MQVQQVWECSETGGDFNLTDYRLTDSPLPIFRHPCRQPTTARFDGRICDSVHRQQRTRSLSRLQAAFRLKPVQQTAVAPNRRCAPFRQDIGLFESVLLRSSHEFDRHRRPERRQTPKASGKRFLIATARRCASTWMACANPRSGGVRVAGGAGHDRVGHAAEQGALVRGACLTRALHAPRTGAAELWRP
jgi:hypothetical protein